MTLPYDCRNWYGTNTPVVIPAASSRPTIVNDFNGVGNMLFFIFPIGIRVDKVCGDLISPDLAPMFHVLDPMNNGVFLVARLILTGVSNIYYKQNAEES